MENPLDYVSSLKDEVALEGLDGITLTMFWKRLEDRPNFPIALDDNSKAFLWECIALHKDIEIYELPMPREFVAPYNRYDHIDGELGIVIEPLEKIKDPYFPVVPINDGDIRGSCSTYKTRKCITAEIRNDYTLLMSVTQVFEKWGESLVLVASPKARLIALIGTEADPLIAFTIESYCLLERIGRSRYIGEVTQGDDGLLSLQTTFCKQLHYYRKKLSNKGLITKQIHYLKNKKGTTSNGCLLHLTRFYVQRKTKMEFLMKALCDLLKDKPHNRETCAVARQELGIKESTFKKLFYRPFQKWILISNIPYSEFYPEATYKESHTLNGTEKTLKIVQLLKHYDDDNDEHEQEKECESSSHSSVHFDYSKVYHGLPFLLQAFNLIKEAGPEGISSGDLGRIMTLPRLDIRNLLRVLTRKKYVISMLEDRGRQKVTKYIAKAFEKENEVYSIVKGHELSNTDTSSINKGTLLKRKINSDESSPPLKKKVGFDNETLENPVEQVVSENQKSSKASSESDFQNIVSQVLELHNSEHFSGRSPKVISLSEKPPIPCPYSTASPQLTYRKLKRATMILEYLEETKFTTIGELQKVLREREKEEEYKLDKRSTARLVHSLANQKKIKIFKVVLKLEDKKASIEFICDNSMDSTDQRLLVAIEQAKFKYFSVNKEKSKKSISPAKCMESLEKTACEEKSQTKSSHQTFLSTNTPKFVKSRLLHQFLFHLVYEHKGSPVIDGEQPVYKDEMSWKRFVPPLPEYPDKSKEGWCFLADIYSRLPLSLFVKLVAIRSDIPNLQTYLNDEEKQHYLIKYLPQDLRNALLDNRKYLFSTYDVIRNLCYLGLVSLGPQIGKQKDQIFLYVHRNASLKDTTTSTPGYIHIQKNIEYETKYYTFKSLQDVENFWLEFESICFHTLLGKYNSAIGKTIAITEAIYKPELKKCTENNNFDEVIDSSTIPGDGLGAAGFDSSMFLHIKRNWLASTMIKPSVIASKNDSRPITQKFTIQNLLKTKGILKPENRSRLQRLTKVSLSLQKDKLRSKSPQLKQVKVKSVISESSRRQKVKYRTLKNRSSKKRSPYYDEIDKAAMKKLKKSRCEWLPQEDSFLLICKVASSFLDPLYSKNLVVPFTVVRDLLHEHLPGISESKSSRACQRRLRYMMLNPITVSNVAIFLGEAKQDHDLVQEFNKPKPPKSQLEIWKDMFTKVLDKLLKKFTLPAADRCKNINLPNSLEEFNKTFTITYSRDILCPKQIHKDPKSNSEVKSFVFDSLIRSAMALPNEDTRWKYLLLYLYKTYPQTLLQSVIANLRRNKVIAIKKSHTRTDLKCSKNLSPYKFSIIYENALLTKFPVKIFHETQNLLGRFSPVNDEVGIELKGDVPPGYAAAVLSLTAVQQLIIHIEIPEQIILFDTSLSQEACSSIVERISHTLSSQESIELSRILDNETNSTFSVIEESVSNTVEKRHEDHMSDDDSSNPNNLSVRSTNASRYALYLLRQEMSQPPIEKTQHSQDYIVLNSCRIFCNLKSDENVVLPLNPRKIIEQIPDHQKTVVSDFFVKNQEELNENRVSEISKALLLYIPHESFKIQNYADSIAVIYKQYSPQTLLEAKLIFHHIYSAEVTGVSENSLWKEFNILSGELSLFQHLHLLRESFLVIRVGITCFNYVCIKFSKSWLLESCILQENIPQNECDLCSINNKTKEKDESACNHNSLFLAYNKCEKVYFIPRTWRNPDGTLNRTTFFDLLNTVLSHIISFPSISVKDVCERFALVMQPVQTLELIEVLEKTYCIYKYFCKPMRTNTLFSKLQTACVTENPDPEDIDHLENFPDAICKISHLQRLLL